MMKLKIITNRLRFIIKMFLVAILLNFSIVLVLITITNPNISYSKMLSNDSEQFIQIEKANCDLDRNCFQLSLTNSDEDYIESKLKFKHYNVYRISDLGNYLDSSDLFKINRDNISENMYLSSLDVDVVVVDNFKELISEKIIGRFPEKENEILISNYLADIMIIAGLTTYENEFYYPNNYDDILNQSNTYYFGDSGSVKIVGIINYDLSDYEKLKKCYYLNQDDGCDKNLKSKLVEMTRNNLNKVYVLPRFINSHSLNINGQLDQSNYSYKVINNNITDIVLVKCSRLQESVEYYDGVEWLSTSHINSDEIILNIYQIITDSNSFEKTLSEYIDNHSDVSKEELEKQFLEKYIQNTDIIGNEVIFRIIDQDGDIKEEKKLRVIGISTYNYGNTFEHYYVSDDIDEIYELNPLQKTGYLLLTNEINILQVLNEFHLIDNYIVETSYTENYLATLCLLDRAKTIIPFITALFMCMVICLISSFINSSVIKNEQIEIVNKLKMSIVYSTVMILFSSVFGSLFIGNTINMVNKIISLNFDMLEINYKVFIILFILDIIILVFVYIVNRIKLKLLK